MRPIRKQELEYLDRLINNKFQEKKSAVSSQCELEISNQLEKDFNKFISTLKLDKLIKEAEQAEKEYQDFIRNKDNKQFELQKNASEAREALTDKMQQWAKIRNWDIRTSVDSVSEAVGRLKGACRDELEIKYKNSEKGKVFRYLENGVEDAKNILYSGLSIEDVWKNLDQVFNQAQIEVRVPKSFAQIAK